MAHVVGVLTGNAGAKPFLYSNKQIITLYSAIGGYVPGKPSTDQGCDEQTALNYWENNGAPVGSHKIAGWLAVNGTDAAEVRTALWLFENLYFGMELPDKWITPFPSASGFIWDAAGPPNPSNGHCVVGVGYSAQGVIIDSWGMTGLITDAAIAKYATTAGNRRLYTVVSQDGLNKATSKSPGRFRLEPTRCRFRFDGWNRHGSEALVVGQTPISANLMWRTLSSVPRRDSSRRLLLLQ